MFTILDFFNLMSYFKGETSPEMDTKLVSLAEDSKAKATTLFNDSIDQFCHSTDDYKRFKEFLISWYASLKTFPTEMRQVSDIRILPDAHLNELFASFGFTIGLTEIPKNNKIDFFYDLVNLYKIKGTPEALDRALVYSGIPELDVIEFWLQYDEDGNLVFRPQLLTNKGNNSNIKDLPFESTIVMDPHWMLTADEVNHLFSINKIAFPSKTPYFGIRPTVQLVGNIINPIMCILTRLVLDQYESYISGSPPAKDTYIPVLDIQVSLLDLYLSVVYAFNKLYPKTFNPSELYTYIYNKSFTGTTYEEIIDLFDEILSRANTKTRDDINTNRELFNETFSKLRSENFLVALSTAGTVLNVTNKPLKDIIDTNYDLGNADKTLQLLVKNLVLWIQNNVDPRCPNLLVTMFGLNVLDHITQLINFFKPYRARLILVEHTFTIKLPALDTVIPEDYFNPDGIGITQYFYDYDTADSKPGYADQDEYPPAITSTPPQSCSRRITNMWADSTGNVVFDYIDSTAYVGHAYLVYSSPPAGGYRIWNAYLELLPAGGRALHVIAEEEPEPIGGISTRIYSIPEVGHHRIIDVYLNCSSYFEMLYDEVPYDGVYNDRRYYTRNYMDCGSYFDIGASTDDPPYNDEDHDLTREPFSIYITHNEYDKYNYHVGDSTSESWFEYDTEHGRISTIRTGGGWVGFDEDAVFDMSPITDVCVIEITEEPIPVQHLYSDEEFPYQSGMEILMETINTFVQE